MRGVLCCGCVLSRSLALSLLSHGQTASTGPAATTSRGNRNGGDGHTAATINPMEELGIGSNGPMQQRAAKTQQFVAGEQD